MYNSVVDVPAIRKTTASCFQYNLARHQRIVIDLYTICKTMTESIIEAIVIDVADIET
jgi:hypothetical protein